MAFQQVLQKGSLICAHTWFCLLLYMLSATGLSTAKMYLSSSKRSFRSQESTLRKSIFSLIPAIQIVSLDVYAVLNFFDFDLE